MTEYGRWSERGVPHKGWSCLDVLDLGYRKYVCAMCQKQEIRYAHYMTHPKFEGHLIVGCVCAEKLSGDYVNPRLRESRLRKRSSRRDRWVAGKWKTTDAGSLVKKLGDFVVTVYEKPFYHHWSFSLRNARTGRMWFSKKRYTAEQVKGVSFDAILWAEKRS